MGIIAKNTSTVSEPVPAGTHVARCYQMIEIGTVSEAFPGQDAKQVRKVRIGWELPEETKVFNPEKGEQPFVISKEFSLSMHEKANLRKSLESWRGKGFSEDEAKAFDITNLIGKPCLLNIIHKPSKDGSRVYSDIAGIMPLPKNMKCSPQVNPTVSLSYDDFDMGVYNSLPDFIKDKMKGSLEFQAMQNPAHSSMGNGAPDYDHVNEMQEPVDDLPF